MLVEFHVQQFKSFREARLPLAELTVLIGANASGKSNLIEALQLLSWLARGRRLSEVLYALKDQHLSIRGPISRLGHGADTLFRLGGVVRKKDGGELELDVGLSLRGGEFHINTERAFERPSKEPLYEVFIDDPRYSAGLIVFYNNFGEGSSTARDVTCTDDQAIFTQLTTPARFANEHETARKLIPWAAKQLQATFESIVFLDPMPRRMRDYSFTDERELQGDGFNLSAVLYDLCENQQRRRDVLAFVRALPEQNILDMTFLKGPRGEVMVQLTESFGGTAQTYEAALLSDGTLRVLAVAAALLSVPKGSLVVIEEIDNGVHPTRAKLLLDNIQRVARERELRVLLTTHNPALLDAIPLDAIPNVVACYRDPKEGDSRLMPLSRLPDYPELVAQGPVGQLVTRGILERYLKSPKTVEEKAAQAQKLLEMLQAPPGEP